jgi:hypothetical protein
MLIRRAKKPPHGSLSGYQSIQPGSGSMDLFPQLALGDPETE